MLQNLSVKNLAIVEEAAISFGRGLNIITGETGAGKSVLMGALNLVLGGRADKSVIRTGATEARVEAVFFLSDTNLIDAQLAERDIPLCEEGQLIIKRSISTQETGRTFINDSPVALQTLRTIAPLLVDIHGPYDQQSLLKQEFQRSLLDSYGKCGGQLGKYQTCWKELQVLNSSLTELTSDTSDAAEEIDRLNFIINDIRNAALTEADAEDLIEQYAQAANAEEIISLGSGIAEMVLEGEPSACSQLLLARSKTRELIRILPEAENWLTDIQGAILNLQEIGSTIAGQLSHIETDPAQLQRLEERMSLVQSLKRKYGGSIEAVLGSLEKYELRLDNLANRAEKVAALQQQIDLQVTLLHQMAALLSAARKKAGVKIAVAITSGLQDLGFLNAAFDVAVEPCPPAPHGADEIIFEFAPNPGEPARPLKTIASSGEIARVMLAVKAVLAAHDSIPVLVFDEIDANIGGEIGRAVGQKLRHVAMSHQVISITHLPQSAVYGEQHVRVSKEVHNKRTKMTACILNDDERVDEIARMLGGKGLTSVIENHAREMLESARQPPVAG